MLTPLLLAVLPQITVGPATPIPDPTRAIRRPFVTFVTGELGPIDVIFELRFDPRIAASGRLRTVLAEPRGAVDGIDFVPGGPTVVVGMPVGIVSHYDISSGAILPDFVPDTDIALPPGTAGTHPSTVLSTPGHVYYVENQFGFGATPLHRIVRKPWGPGPAELVYDGAPHGLKNFEGLEIVFPRLYFFAEDSVTPTARALVSIGLGPGGLHDGIPPSVAIPGLFEDPTSTDGSDELDLDVASGLIFGTNIENGEVIAWDPIGASEVSSPGAAHFVDGGQVSASTGALSALGAEIDGIRGVGNGWLVMTGKGGLIVSLDVAGVLADGADDGDARVLVSMPGAAHFDDLTPIIRP